MAEWFSFCFRNSLLASVMILAVLALRPLLRKAPRNIACLLWLLVAVRLLLPFQLESPLSLQPRQLHSTGHITVELQADPSTDETITELPVVSPTAPPVTELPPVSTTQSPVTEHLRIDWGTGLSILWAAGCLSLLVYAVVSYLILRHRVEDAVKTSDGAWESDRIEGAFLLGYFSPRIYLPTGLDRQDREFILAHERSHQKRGDHWWKLLGMLCLSLHWYNPLIWLSYAFLCRDLEVACDERVVCSMVLEERRAYSFALLNSGKRMSGFLAYPVAFGEVSLKTRIKNVLSYRKPGIRVTATALVLTTVVGICFMTSPVATATVIYKEPEQITTEAPTVPTTEATAPSKPVTPPTLPTEPVTVPTEPVSVPTKPKPTEPKPTKPTEPTPTKPPVTEPTQPEPTVRPTTAPTQPQAPEPVVTLPPKPSAPAPEPEPEDTDIGCGDRISWYYNEETRHLTLSGSGPMKTGNTPPWQAYKSRILGLTISSGITAISTDAFSGCTELRSVSIPGSVLTIEKCAFHECTNLKAVTLNEGLQTIGMEAFEGTGIRSLVIPKTVIQINNGAFSDCQSLSRITFTGIPPKLGSNTFDRTTATVYYPEQSGSWQYAMDDYGGEITWKLCCNNHSYINGVCERCGLKKGA